MANDAGRIAGGPRAGFQASTLSYAPLSIAADCSGVVWDTGDDIHTLQTSTVQDGLQSNEETT